jgi:Zn-dependent protease
MNLFRVRGIQLAVHFSFFLLLAVFAFSGWAEAEWTGLAWYVAMLCAFFVCVTLHELGHCFTAMAFGVRVRRILLMPIGGMAEFEDMPRRPLYELLVTLAGPAVNFVIAGILWLCVARPASGWFATEFPATATGFAQMLLAWNIMMGCFNLLPIFPMDGGRIFRATLATRLPYLRATWIAATVGKVLAVTVAGTAVVLYRWDAGMLVVLFSFIIFAGEMEYRAAKRREMEDAHWREVVARLNYAAQS